jgi:hypothetical protein
MTARKKVSDDSAHLHFPLVAASMPAQQWRHVGVALPHGGVGCGNFNATRVSGLPEIVRNAAMLGGGEGAGKETNRREEDEWMTKGEYTYRCFPSACSRHLTCNSSPWLVGT